jgi:small GTP-binding protein
MQVQSSLRLSLAALILVLTLVIIAVLLLATDTALSLWHQLTQLSPGAAIAYLVFVLLLTVIGVVVAWRMLRPPAVPNQSQNKPAPIAREHIEQQLHDLHAQGVDTQAAQHELDTLDQRHQEAHYFVALFGSISSGKSSLINALTQTEQQATSALGGTTQSAYHSRWQLTRPSEPDAEITVELIDLPGFAQVDAQALAAQAQQEASRAHVVVYVCDGDLNREQYQALQALVSLGKPMVIALNKSDWYRPEELAQLQTRLQEYLPDDALWSLVPVQAASSELVTVIDAQGEAQEQRRRVPARIDALREQLYTLLVSDPQDILQRLQHSALHLAQEQLSLSQAQHRSERAQQLIQHYSRRAMIGALAAVAPGTDLVIQGALGTALVRALCQLYEVPVREVDIDQFLQQSGQGLRRNTSITLAVAGNALKAFPGLGTIAGGLVHALAYGMIFHSLGQALAQSLQQASATQQRWQPAQGAAVFEEQLIGHLETPAKALVRTAVEQFQQQQRR